MGKDLLMYEISTPPGHKSTKSINQAMWEELDSLVDVIMSNDKARPARDQARGLAFALSLTMKPLFITSKEISEEALKRYNHRQAGREYQTPCVGERWRENPVTMREVHVLGRKLEEGESTIKPELMKPSLPGPHKLKPRSSVTYQLKADAVASIKKSTLPDNALAALYGVPEQTIKNVRSSG